jgi:hypothetical protein
VTLATTYPLRHQLGRELAPAAADFVAAALRRTYRIESLEFRGDEIVLEFGEPVEAEAFAAVARRLEFVTGKMTDRTFYENRPGRPAPPDPFAALVARRDVQPLGRGLFLLQGEFLRLHRHFDEYWRSTALDLGAVEQDNPGVWPVELYRRIDYFADFPHQVIMAAPVKPGHTERAAAARTYGRRAHYAAVATEHLAPSTYGLQCAVCDSCYFALQGVRDHADTLYTTRNKVFRNEASETGSLDRLTSFTVRDIMFVGSERYVRAQRDRMLELAVAFLDELDLDAAIVTANDPFFAGDAMAKTVYQNTADLKQELLVALPFAGREMAIGSVNLHQDFFGRSFDIAQADGQPVWSGCLGIGFERLVYALYAQYGLDLTMWPAQLRAIAKA